MTHLESFPPVYFVPLRGSEFTPQDADPDSGIHQLLKNITPVLSAGKHILTPAQPTSPHQPGEANEHMVYWIEHEEKTPWVPECMEELLQDNVFLDAVHAFVIENQRNNPSLRVYMHLGAATDTAKEQTKDIAYRRTMQSIPRPHIHFVEDTLDAQTPLRYLQPEKNDRDKSLFTLITNAAGDVSMKSYNNVLQTHGTPALYPVAVNHNGYSTGIMFERRLHAFASFSDAFTASHTLLKEVSEGWISHVKKIASMDYSWNGIPLQLKQGCVAGTAIVFLSENDRRRSGLWENQESPFTTPFAVVSAVMFHRGAGIQRAK